MAMETVRAVLDLLAARIKAGITTVPTLLGWAQTAAVLVITALIILPIGFRSGFLTVSPVKLPMVVLQGCLITFFCPGIFEEVIFRAALLPHPTVDGSKSPRSLLLASLLPLIAFTLMHLGNPIPRARKAFSDARFLAFAVVLGAGCTVAYYLTNSVWAAVAVHWLPVAVWLFLLGGYDRMQQPHAVALPGHKHRKEARERAQQQHAANEVVDVLEAARPLLE